MTASTVAGVPTEYGTMSEGAVAWGPRARTTLGTGSGSPAPDARRRSTTSETRLGRCVVGQLQLQLPEPGEDPTVEHRALVVGEDADAVELASGAAKCGAVPPAPGAQCEPGPRRGRGLREAVSPARRRTRTRRGRWRRLGGAGRRGARARCELHRPAVVAAVAQACPGAGEPKVGRVVVRGRLLDRRVSAWSDRDRRTQGRRTRRVRAV